MRTDDTQQTRSKEFSPTYHPHSPKSSGAGIANITICHRQPGMLVALYYMGMTNQNGFCSLAERREEAEQIESSED